MVTKKQIAGSGDVKRKYLACAVNVSDEKGTPEYVVVGYKISSSTLEFNPDVETGTDINGRAYSSVNKTELSQTFEPHRLTSGDNGKLAAKLINIIRSGELEKLSQFECIIIYGMLSEGAPYEADMYDACTITPESLGGESWAEMPFTVNFGGEVKHGSVDKLIGAVTFTGTPVA